MPNGDPVVYQLSARIDELASRVESLTKITVERTKTQWGVIGTFAGVIILALGYLGDLALSPLKEKLAEIKTQMDQMVTKDDVNKRLIDINNKLNELNLKIYDSNTSSSSKKK